MSSALRPKEGQQLCGDQLATVETGGMLYLLLSDGMGSGPEAHREAALTVRLLEQFLRAGIEAGSALKTLNSALALRGRPAGPSPPSIFWLCAAPPARPPSINTALRPPISSTPPTSPASPPIPFRQGLQATTEPPEVTRLALRQAAILS